jgi:tetrahydromethanopterin S-methyltransferase subunit G
MAVMPREAWTDERLDDLNERVDRLEQRMDAGFAEMREEFRALRADIQHLTYGLIGTMLLGFLGTIVALVTQT